jgi:hypothetical protein
MEKKTTGAWLLHHNLKLQQITGTQEFNAIGAAGKAGTLLSALSANDQVTLNRPEVEALAKAANINVLYELDFLLDKLKKRKLIETSAKGVDVLGVTSGSTLERTAEVFEDLQPTGIERASLLLSESASESPLRAKESAEYLSDTCKLSNAESSFLLESAEQIGFVDFEDLGGGDKVYFNGNLFRRNDLPKIQAVLASVSAAERKLVSEVEAKLKISGCMSVEEVKKMLSENLFSKLNAISMYDISVVNNEMENIAYVTRPAAFSKYGDPFIEDALDLAKAFVSSVTYGMTRSGSSRGRITMPVALMGALVQGRWIGPVTAIGQDYKVLEMKGVVKVRKGTAGWGYEMKLLKKEVGEIALKVISGGDASDLSILKFPSASVSSYSGPETNREARRKVQKIGNKKETRDIIMALRTGGAF